MNVLHFMGDGNIGPRGGKLYLFHCPGCENAHPFEVGDNGWTWNGSMEKPTFFPSLLVNAGTPELRCHSFVRDGQIEFLSDCFHALAGKTVALPEWED